MKSVIDGKVYNTETAEEVKEFCDKAKKRGISFNSIVDCINTLESGRRMSGNELEACDFLGEPNVFWNPGGKHSTDYLDNVKFKIDLLKL